MPHKIRFTVAVDKHEDGTYTIAAYSRGGRTLCDPTTNPKIHAVYATMPVILRRALADEDPCHDPRCVSCSAATRTKVRAGLGFDEP